MVSSYWIQALGHWQLDPREQIAVKFESQHNWNKKLNLKRCIESTGHCCCFIVFDTFWCVLEIEPNNNGNSGNI